MHTLDTYAHPPALPPAALTPATFVRIATGPSPTRPAAVVRVDDGFYVDGVATVQARPHRKARHARQLAERIARDPAAYLDVLTGLDVPGVVDHRPTSHADRRHGRAAMEFGPADYSPVPPPSNARDRGRFGRRFDPARPWPLSRWHNVDRRASDPLAAACRTESLARLPDVLPPAVYAGVAAFLDGADGLPGAVAAEVRGLFTAAEFAEQLGLVARIGGGRWPALRASGAAPLT